MKLTKDRAIGIILIIIGTIFIILTSQIPEPKFFTEIVGPDLFPYIASIGMVLCGVALLFRGKKDEEKFLTKAGWFRVLKMALLILSFVFLMNYAGFIVASLILLFGMVCLFDLKKETSILKKIIYAVVLTAIVYVLFQFVLNIKLPSGELFEWLKDLR